ncbi:SE1561 family protein [Aquibacillus salsiterrae]|uniref:SE1561 family protein n=1 Tax=Aquibacillus salsiterrae TaxID=2950439 RepID=A0A9X3WIU4_9BACI|nr:SE1561 family protein [Aquibacillus salsiterrae]MDC3418174.1 SE1561 family protein [Aquibacillus salsiterrae]
MEQKAKVEQLKEQLQGFLLRLDSLDPAKMSIDDIDQLIRIIERMEQDLH